MESLFAIAEASAHGILYLMALMSVVSVAIMIERYVALKRISSSSKGVAAGFKTLIENKDLNQIVKLSEDTGSLEGRALETGLTYVKHNGANGLEDLFNSFKVIEKPALEKNLNSDGDHESVQRFGELARSR
jgi:biopolymer transport protein ExbB/TolQ